MDVIFAGLGGAAVTSIISYLIARRNNSGSVSTSDAASLWAESNTLRKEYRLRAEKLEEQLEEVNRKLAEVTEELGRLKVDSVNMTAKISELQKTIDGLRQENRRLLELKKEIS